MAVREDIKAGHKYGKLSVIQEIKQKLIGGKPVRMFELQCECGNVVEKQLKVLRLGTRSCGCDNKRPGFPATAKNGDVFKTNEGYSVEIVDYNVNFDVKVKFLDEFGAVIKTNIQAIRNGSVANPYHKSVYGVACYGEPEDDWQTVKPLYNTWAGMIERVHDLVALEKRQSYKPCIIVESWYCFANFYSWAKYQIGWNNPRWQLDKDILVKGNKVYGPDTCCFVPSQINALFTKREAERGDLPIGVTRYTTRQGKKRNVAIVSDPDVKHGRRRGCFGKSTEECFLWYKENKEQVIKNQANKYKDQIDPKIYAALLNYEVEITD